jgi:hypothetical protein
LQYPPGLYQIDAEQPAQNNGGRQEDHLLRHGDRVERFLHIHTSKYLHLNERATSRAESAHWLLKHDLHVSLLACNIRLDFIKLMLNNPLKTTEDDKKIIC